MTEWRITGGATPRAVLVTYDCSRRAERALAQAVELCRDTHARLGVAIIQRPVLFNSPWVCIAAPLSERELLNGLLCRLPDDVSVRFLLWRYTIGMREIAQFAERLDCDAVLLPYSGRRARRAARVLTRRGVAVVVHADGVQQLGPGQRAIRRATHAADPRWVY
jgi:nucleotide-binding universal stress UspA family protein